MNKEQFTPGPWRIKNVKVEYPCTVLHIETCNGIQIAEMADDDNGAKFINANLIAAAPDMHEALKKAVFLIQGYMVAYGHGPSATSELEYLNAALNKANPQ
jgi:hypothetical protein